MPTESWVQSYERVARENSQTSRSEREGKREILPGTEERWKVEVTRRRACLTKVSLYLSKVQTRFRRPTRAISLTLWEHLFPSTPPYAILPLSLCLFLASFSPLPAFFVPSLSIRRLSLPQHSASQRVVFKCTNEATDQRNRRQCVHSHESKGRTGKEKRERRRNGDRQRLLLSSWPPSSSSSSPSAVPPQHPV